MPLAVAQAGEAFGVSPVSVSVPDALRGESYIRRVTVHNQLTADTDVAVTAGGDIAVWISSDPMSGFAMPAHSQREVELMISVPSGAPGGTNSGFVQFITDPVSTQAGTGSSIRYAVSVPVTVTLDAAGSGGGAGGANIDLRWSDAAAGDVEVGSPPSVSVRLSNEGNIRTIGHAKADIVPFGGDDLLATAETALEVIPGDIVHLAFPFTDPLPVGQYRARVTSLDPAGFEQTVSFKVLEVGALGKDGLFRGLRHDTSVRTGDTLRFEGLFANTGNVSIASARLVYEVWLGERLLEASATGGQVAPIGADADLVAFFKPQEAGEHRIVAHVVYDGLLTETRESKFVALRSGDVLVVPWWVWLVAAAPVAVIAAWLVVAARRRGPARTPADEPAKSSITSVAERMRRFRRR